MSQAELHQPVLLDEALKALAIRPEGCYLDGTFGRGGHTRAILQALGARGCVVALDRDPQAIAFGQRQFAGEARLHLYQESFARMKRVVEEMNRGVNGILLDLGVSSPQLDEARRGFSFQHDGPLDMRMDPGQGMSAAQWLAEAPESEIADVLWRYGEERHARRIARAIVEQRFISPLQRTLQLARLIESRLPRREPGKHPATRTFQAIRIFINDELEQLRQGLHQALDCLVEGGRLVVISFHSLEDRIVKRFLREQMQGEVLPKGVPVMADQLCKGRVRILGKPVRPSAEEIARNPRARSAIMRVACKQ